MSKELCASQQCVASNECMALRSVRKINECFRDQEEINTQIRFSFLKAEGRNCPNIDELKAKIEPQIKAQENLLGVLPQQHQ